MLAALGLASALAAAPGDALSAGGLLAQDGRPFSIRALHGRAAAISFVYTRCEDAAFCPAVAGKFAWLARRIDPRSEHLVLITLDPAHDTPAALRAYAARLGTDPARLTLVTGDPARVWALLRTLGVSAGPPGTTGRIVHDERLILLDARGRVADAVGGVDWDPATALRELDGVAHLSGNAVAAALIGATWSFEHLCGAATTDEGTSLHHALVALALALPPVAALPFLLLARRRGLART